MSNCCIDIAVVQQLTQIIRQSIKLADLDLSGCGITSDQAIQIFNAMNTNYTIERLNVSNNRLAGTESFINDIANRNSRTRLEWIGMGATGLDTSLVDKRIKHEIQ